jgi:predicted DsbA family dithiol-disulfide isomerase
VQLAAEAGLEPDEVRRVLAGDAYAEAVSADAMGALALGATGVPFVVVDGRYGIAGAKPVEVFARMLTGAWADSHPRVPAGGGGVTILP